MKLISTLCLLVLSLSCLQAQTPSSASADDVRNSIVLNNLPAAPDEVVPVPDEVNTAEAQTASEDEAVSLPQSGPQESFFEEPEFLPSKTVLPNALQGITARMGLPLPLPQARVVILKSQRRLELWSGTTLVKVYKVALGGHPVGAKKKQSDSRTPEGRFTIVTRNNTTSAFHVFLGLDYPLLSDAARGVRSGLITRREYQTIKARLASRQRPLWETRLGGWVGIHGGTGNAFAQKQANKRGSNDWTAGCIALTDQEIEEVYSATKLGTPVWIRP